MLGPPGASFVECFVWNNADFNRLHPYKTHLKTFESMVRLQLKMSIFSGNHSNGNLVKMYEN